MDYFALGKRIRKRRVEQGMTQEQLARRIYQNKSSVARQLAVLEEAGFVRRVCCDSDRRVTELYPTERAKAALPEIRQGGF